MTEYRGQGTADASTATTTSILREAETASASQVTFNLSTAVYTPGTNQLMVYVDGVKKVLTTDYTETSSTVVTFGSGMTGGEVVEFVAIVGVTDDSTTDATKSVFTHDNTGAVQTTVDEALKALAVDLTADLKAVAGAEVQTAYVRGRDSVGDGYSGFYYWNSTSTATDTSATTTLVVQQNGVTTGRWLKNTSNTFSGAVTIGGDLNVDGTTQATSTATGSIQTDGGIGVTKSAWLGNDLVIEEAADHTSTPAAGKGILWVKSDVPATLQFTDDAGTDFDISAAVAGGTITIADEGTDTTCFPIFATAATGAVAGKSNAALTYNSNTNDLGSTTFTGALVGNADTATTAGTVTTAAQPNITSVGTLTALDVDNIQINGNDISSTGGTDLTITPLAGQQIVLDGAIVVDAGVVTGATSITSTAFVGDLTGEADTVTTNANLTGGVTSVGNAATVVTNANLTGDVTSVGNATTLTVDAITGQTDIGGAIVDADELIINDGGNIRRTDMSRVATYLNNFVAKASDESLNTSTTLQDDDDLQVTLDANSAYRIEMMFKHSGTDVTPDIKWLLVEPDGTFRGMAWITNPSGGGAAVWGKITDATIDTAYLLESNTTTGAVSVDVIADTAGAGGIFKLQWAQNGSHASNVTIESGSWIRATKLA